MKKFDLIIIGAGSGGLSAAASAARLGLKTLLVEKNKLGGDCLWNGCIPSKTLIHEADKMRVMKEEGINLDYDKHFTEAKLRIKMVQEKIGEHDSVERFTNLGCEVLMGEAKFIGKNKIIVNNTKYKFKKCIIATGSRPMIPEIFKAVKYFTNETIFDIHKLPKTMTVVGGGSIGVEIASAFAMFGVKINMIVKEDRVMPKEEPEVGEFMKNKMQSLGISFYNNVDVEQVFERDNFIDVKLKGGLILEGDVLFVATGRLFNTDLDLEKAGVSVGPRKEILIDKYLQTTNKKIFAIGDVNGFRLFTHAAGYQAKAVIQNIIVPSFLPFLKKNSIPEAFPWVTYTYPEVAHVGLNKKELDDKKIEYKSYITKLESVDRATTSKIEEGFIDVVVGKKGKILAVTIVSPHAGELITEWVLAMEYKLPVDAIFNTVHAYPTLSELNPRGTFSYMSEKLTPGRSRLLRLLFKL